MSIFPKRSVPGKTVTIHWNFNISSLKNTHIFPFFRLGVKDPNGNVNMIFEEHILGLPNPDSVATESKKGDVTLKYLNKNIPLLLLADYLSGSCKREKLIDILRNIQSGRHYYFSYTLPNDAPLGKYTLVSEIHSSGETKYSKTAKDDFFFVEKITLNQLKKNENKAVITNHSPEKTPIKIVECQYNKYGNLNTKVRVFEIEPLKKTVINLSSNKEFLLYNEEREVIPLTRSSIYALRNQQILEMQKKDKTYLLHKHKEEFYELTEEAEELWKKSDGLYAINKMTNKEREIFDEMSSEGLIEKITFNSQPITG